MKLLEPLPIVTPPWLGGIKNSCENTTRISYPIFEPEMFK
jgi:hypothetical protein